MIPTLALAQFGRGGYVSDPNFSSVVSLLHMDGTDESTTFTDVRGKTWTANGDAQIDTAQSKWGGASALFDGTGDYIDTPDHDDFSLSSNPFTIEMWIRFNVLAGGTTYCIAGQCNAAASDLVWTLQRRSADSKIIFTLYNTGGVGTVAIHNTVPVTGQWYHLACCRNSNNKIYICLDGDQGSEANFTTAVKDNTFNLALGRQGEFNSLYFNGWIDDFRFTNGFCRYTADFTPPLAPFPNA